MIDGALLAIASMALGQDQSTVIKSLSSKCFFLLGKSISAQPKNAASVNSGCVGHSKCYSMRMYT